MEKNRKTRPYILAAAAAVFCLLIARIGYRADPYAQSARRRAGAAQAESERDGAGAEEAGDLNGSEAAKGVGASEVGSAGDESDGDSQSEQAETDETLDYTDAHEEHHTMKIDDAVRRNLYDPDKFEYESEDSERITYRDDDYEVLQGIDVAEYQGYINWEKVKEAGFDFVFVRVAYRGYGEEGNLLEDARAVEYMRDAKEAGLYVGAFVFSQAVNEQEAREEAELAAEVIGKSGVSLDLPLVYDPEIIAGEDGRANDITREQVALNTLAFRDAAEKACSCKVAIYSNLYWESNLFSEEILNQFEIWYADYVKIPQTPYHFTWWQYSERGTVPGVEGLMDLNLWIRRME